MKILHYFNLFLLSVAFVACEKKDSPVTLPPKGDGMVMQVNMGEEYEEQFYVSLENKTIVHSTPSNLWDLAFSCDPDVQAVFMNGGQGMCAYPTGKSDFAQVGLQDTALAQHNWMYDGSSGVPDSAVLGKWGLHNNQVFIVKLGSTDLNYKKIKIIQADQFQYTIQVGTLTETNPETITLVKHPEANFIYFSLHHFTELTSIEPPKSSYDLRFTTYNYTFYEQNPPLRYIVVGCLINPNNTLGYKDSIIGFNHFTKDHTTPLHFSNHWDVIGYDWKKIDWASGSTDYTIDNRFTFIIKTQHNRYFKLRFIDFYSPTGEKGSPKFEFQEL